MRSVTLLSTLLLSLTAVHAFIGITLPMYNPSCAYSCRAVISSAKMACPAEVDHSEHGMTHAMKRHGAMAAITPLCRSTSVPFLTTLAYCINKNCFPEFNPPRERLEWYWYKYSTGSLGVVEPMWGYQEAFDNVTTAPAAEYDKKDGWLNGTMLINKDAWQAEKQSMEAFEWAETLNSRYCLTIFLVGVGVPILLTALTYLPFCNSLAHWLKARYIYPTLISRHVQPLYRVFHLPTVGQSLFIGLLTVMAIVLTAVEHTTTSPNTWFETTKQETMAYVANRTGALAMALMPLTILFAGRNNILLWMTNWSHSTYLLLHRWVARICALQVVLHSIIELAFHLDIGDYESELLKEYWIWGCVATVAAVILILASQVRRYYYEVFLITHILLAVFFIVGTWYHIELLFTRKWAYEYWIYLCCGIWFFDRVIRLGRILKVGIKKAVLTSVGDEIVRVDIPGVRWSVVPGHHAYVFLPATRKWAPWENHPFSVVPTSLLSRSTTPSTPRTTSTSGSTTPDIEKSEKSATTPLPVLSSQHRPATTTGITFYLKRHKGLTANFTSSSTFSALLDGPYRNTSSRPVLDTDRLILFAGGVGITGILPFVHAHPNVKVYWSVRSSQVALVEELEHTIPGHVERSILIGERNDIDVALAEEVKAGWGLVGAVVCGPGSMCDQVRNRVAWLGKKYPTTKWELDVEAFLW